MLSLLSDYRYTSLLLFWLYVNIFTQAYCDFKGNIDDGRINSRIVGGMFARESQFPFQVSLQSISQNHLCNGIIVGKKWVLSVKSCNEGAPPYAITILAGSNNFSEPDSIVTHKSIQIITHEDADLLLIKITEDFVLSDLIKIATLPEEDVDLPVAKMASAAGWGLSQDISVIQHTLLLFVRQRIMTPRICEQTTGFKEADGYFCTISPYHRGLCYHDEGASLVTDDGVVVGMATVDRFSCGDGYPEVFIKLSAYVSWIKTTMASNTVYPYL